MYYITLKIKNIDYTILCINIKLRRGKRLSASLQNQSLSDKIKRETVMHPSAVVSVYLY